MWVWLGTGGLFKCWAGQCEVRLARLPGTIGRWEAAAGHWALGLRIPAPGLGSEDDASPFGLIQPSLGFPLARPVYQNQRRQSGILGTESQQRYPPLRGFDSQQEQWIKSAEQILHKLFTGKSHGHCRIATNCDAMQWGLHELKDTMRPNVSQDMKRLAFTFGVWIDLGKNLHVLCPWLVSSDRMKCETEEMLHWQTAAQYYQAAGYKREYPYGYEYPGRQENIISDGRRENILCGYARYIWKIFHRSVYRVYVMVWLN